MKTRHFHPSVMEGAHVWAVLFVPSSLGSIKMPSQFSGHLCIGVRG